MFDASLLMNMMNSIYAASIVFIVFNVYKIPLLYYVVLIMHLLLVFLTNDFLFPVSYMPDQYRYLYSAFHIRDSLDFLHYYQFDRSGVGNTSNASLFFALFPLPFLNYVYAIAIINFLIYSFIFIFLYNKGILSNENLWFYLLFPSFALYSAIATRDILILFIMIFSIYYLYIGKMIISIFISVFLIFIKAQNFLIFILSLILYNAVQNNKIITLKNLFWFVLSIIVISIFIIDFSGIKIIDHYREALYIEDGGDLLKYKHILNFMDLLTQSFSGAVYMILKPLPWESTKALQLVQSIENIVIFFIIFKLFLKSLKIKNSFATFLNIYFFVAMAIYGIVVFNFGTASRYRFTFEVVYIVFMMFIIRNEKSLSLKV